MVPAFFEHLESNPLVMALGQTGLSHNTCSVLHYFSRS